MTSQSPIAPSPVSSGETTKVEKISDLEKVLQQMWRVASESSIAAASPEKAFTRISLGNLVVVTYENRVSQILEILDRLSIRRPSRVLVVELKKINEPPGLHASIRAVCHLPSPGAPQVCCEQIRLDCDDDSAGLLPAVIASLLEPDLPSVLWWDRDLTVHEEIFLQLAETVGSVLFDLDFAKRYDRIRELHRKMSTVEVHDLAWRRIEPWRRALARVFDEKTMLPLLRGVKTVKIEIESGEHQPEVLRVPAAALLFTGWLMAQLQWKIISPLRLERDAMEAILAGPAGEVHLQIARGEAPSSNSSIACPLESVALRGPQTTGVLLERLNEKGTIGVSIECTDSCPLVRRVAAVSPTADQILGDVLESAIHSDPMYVKAVDRALGLLDL